jgi:hypothetical protein
VEVGVMNKIVNILNSFVFVAATLTIMGVVYEGFALKWFTIVGVLMVTTDCLFMLSTGVNLVSFRRNKKILLLSIISLTMIMIALAMLVAKIEYPVIAHVIWFFYIWFYYGIMLSKDFCVKFSK